ncbi:nicotinamide mononucleotide transporter [bacterium]|nr:nicotinamide mononucleotide transporter [bacterium]
MGKIKKFIIGEFLDWKIWEVSFLVLVYIVALYNGLVLHDNPFAVVAAICGATATAAAGKGKISTYIFGMVGTLCYAYIALKSMVYGNFLLNIFYYFPMQFIGIMAWKKHMKSDKQEIVKTKLTKFEKLIISASIIITFITCAIILTYLNDVHPYIDAITTVGSVFGVILTVKRCFEQWYVWFVVNGLTLYMWIQIVLSGSNVYSTVIQWAAYFLIGIYFMFVWRKELNEKN